MAFSSISSINTNLNRFNKIAVGGNIEIMGQYKIHTFITSGNFTINHPMDISYLIVGGGGGGGGVARSTNNKGSSGGGGGGGIMVGSIYNILPGTYNVTVGLAGIGGSLNNFGKSGGDSGFNNIDVSGGGGGGGRNSQVGGNNGGTFSGQYTSISASGGGRSGSLNGQLGYIDPSANGVNTNGGGGGYGAIPYSINLGNYKTINAGGGGGGGCISSNNEIILYAGNSMGGGSGAVYNINTLGLTSPSVIANPSAYGSGGGGGYSLGNNIAGEYGKNGISGVVIIIHKN